LNAISGHISARMREYYSHYQLSSKLEALNRIESEYNVQRLVADGRKRFKRQQAREQLKRDALKNVKSRRLQLTERSLASSLLSVSIEPPEAPEPMRAVRDNPA
jgi:hypothetical protein